MARLPMPYTMAGLSVVAALLGVRLGQSAIAEIDPAYFSTPPTRFHADLVAASAMKWEERGPVDASLIQGLGDGCIRCVDYPEEYWPDHDPIIDEHRQLSLASVEYEERPEPADQNPAPVPEEVSVPVQRYAYYAVTTETGADNAEPAATESVGAVQADMQAQTE